MGNRIEQYAADRELQFQSFKHDVLESYLFGKLDFNDLSHILDNAFKMGHYVGHCRGEIHVRKAYELDDEGSKRNG